MNSQKIRSSMGGALGVGAGSAIYDGYYHGFSGIAWTKAGIVAAIVLIISLLLAKMRPPKP
ncbi:hypothetical protein ACLB1G_24960 [Oxalobacteraceae bacterium A2-2]